MDTTQLKTGIQIIEDERERIAKDGFDCADDDRAIIAACYATAEPGTATGNSLRLWRLFPEATRIENLARAGALIAIEIDRLQGIERIESVQ